MGMIMGKGMVIAATHSGAGKSLITMAILRALKQQGLTMAAAKVGPDYIDPAFHAKAIDGICYNYDLWAMQPSTLSMVAKHLSNADMAIIEGVLGLFDGSISGVGSTADVAVKLGLPVILVVDAGAMGQSVAALVHGFASYRADIKIAGIIFNNIGTMRHEKMLRAAVKELNIDVIGCLPRHADMVLPSRHLGLVHADEMHGFESFIDKAARYICQNLDMRLLASKANFFTNLEKNTAFSLPPLGQKIAIAKDAAFNFIYPHISEQWHKAGAEISFFSPLNNQIPALDVDAVFFAGGYPELFAGELSGKDKLRTRLKQLGKQGALIYGECGGYMVMGKAIIDKDGVAHKMFDLLDLTTSFANPKRQLGYRQLQHDSQLPWSKNLNGHEFHYTQTTKATGEPLFKACDAQGETHPDMGLQDGKIMGSYAHIIDVRGDE